MRQTARKPSYAAEWLADDRGAIMVIATFFSALIVGLIWYGLGLGEAMIYRERLRETADSVAFNAATIHALGMNMVSMINITMAAVLAILLAATVFLYICIGITLLATACAVLTLGLCGGATDAMVNFDKQVWNVCVDLRKVIFGPTPTKPGILPILNWTEGFVGDLVPWVAHFAVETNGTGVIVRTGEFSPSMIPTRVPILGNWIDQKVDTWYKGLPFSLPSLANKIPAGSNAALKRASAAFKLIPSKSTLRIPDLQRFGLPIQLDKYQILCDHAGNELVQMLAFLIGSIFGGQGEAFINNPFARSVGDLFGFVVGAAPGIFCTGADPLAMLTDGLAHIPLFGKWAAKRAQSWIDKHFPDGLAGQTPQPDTSGTTPDPFKDYEGADWRRTINESIDSMKMFDLAKNGNDWFAVYSTVTGNAALTTGALTGVDVATWGAQSRSPIGSTDDIDGSQAEFYFDCGNTGTNGNDEGLLYAGFGHWGTATDMSPSWSTCKYTANWNMRWKARLRRAHPFQYNVGDSIGVLLYNLSGLERGVRKALQLFESGNSVEVKVVGLDPVKADFEKWISAVVPNVTIHVPDAVKSDVGVYH